MSVDKIEVLLPEAEIPPFETEGGYRVDKAIGRLEAILQSLRKKGWIARSRVHWHLTQQAINYMR